MAILIGICMFAVGALKLLGPRVRANIGSSSGSIRVLARQALEPRKNLYIVRAENTTILIATSGESVHFMTLIEQTGLPEELTAEAILPLNAPMFRKITQLVKDR
jgi:flagellar biogenesis protein FliO